MISILNSIAHHFSEINACFPTASCGQLRQNATYAIMPADTIFRETIGSGSSATIMDFIYDNQGLPFALNYSTNNGSSFTTYYYVLNLQGDVVKLVDGGGTSVASYAYDAWAISFQAPAPRQKSTLCATVGTTTTPKRDSIMYPAVITILRLVGGYTGDRLAKSTGGFFRLVIV